MKLFILVCEDNTYNLFAKGNYFQKQSHIASKTCFGKIQQIFPDKIHTEMWFQKNLCSTSEWVLDCKFATDLQNTFLKNTSEGLLLYFISFVLVQEISNTSYKPAFIIYRPEIVDWSKTIRRFFLFYDIFFEIIPQLLALIEAPVIFLLQFLVKQMHVAVAEPVSHMCFSKKIIWFIPVINLKRNNFIDNEQMSRRYFYLYFLVLIKTLNTFKILLNTLPKPIFLSSLFTCGK